MWFWQLVSFGFGPFQTQIWRELVNEDLWKWHNEGFNAFQPPWKQLSIPTPQAHSRICALMDPPSYTDRNVTAQFTMLSF